MTDPPPGAAEIRDTCLCLSTQRSARTLARRFDRAFAALDLTNGQFSMLTAISGMMGARPGQLAEFLAMDHATVSAALRALQRRGLVKVSKAEGDGRAKIVTLTENGRSLLHRAVAIWQDEHAKLDAALGPDLANDLRVGQALVVHVG